MSSQRIVIAIALIAVSAMAFLISSLLMQDPELAIGAAVALIGFSFVLVNPFTGLASYLVFIYLRPQDYVASLKNAPLMLVLGGVTFVSMLFHLAVRERSIVLTRSPQSVFVLWFFFAIVMSLFARVQLGEIPAAVERFLPTAVMYLLIANLVQTYGQLRATVRFVVFASIVLAAQGLVQYFTGVGLWGQLLVDGRIQAVGVFADPNDLALALLTAFPFVYLIFAEGKRLGASLLALLAMSVLVYALFLTQSRGGLMALGMLMMMMLTRRFGRLVGSLLGGTALAAIFILAPRMSTISTGEASAHGRVEAWSIGLDLFEGYPLFGIGAYNFGDYHFRTAHNSYVLCASELGLFGLYPWIMMIYLSIRNNAFIARELERTGMREMALYVDTIRYALIAFVTGAFFLSRTYNELLFILVGLSAACTSTFVANSGGRYVLVDRRDLVYGLAWCVAGWFITKMFLYTAW